MRVAILDIGKTNAKLALVDTTSARELDVLSMPTPTRDAPHYPQPDVDALWTFVVDALGTLAGRCPDDDTIGAIGITTHGATLALLDADGGLALPVLDYEHDGPDACRDAYEALRPPFAETGSPALPGGLNAGAQLHWQQTRFPEAFARVAHVVTWPQYWAFRLSGALASDLTSLGCHTDLLEPANGAFSSLARSRGWDRLLPPVRRSGERLAPITDALAERTGLTAGTPVHVGIHDSNASLVPHLLADSGPRAVVSSGTWVVVMAIDGDAPPLDPARDTLVNVDARGAPVPSARFMGGREFERLSRGGGMPAPSDSEEDGHVLERVLDGGAMLLPAVVGGSGPYPDRTPSWSVEEGSLDDAAHAVVVAHYLAMMTATCLELVGARGPIAVEGPFAANRHYVRMLAAATGRDVETGVAVTGTSVGTAMLIEAPNAPPVAVSLEIDPGWRARLEHHAAAWRARVDVR